MFPGGMSPAFEKHWNCERRKCMKRIKQIILRFFLGMGCGMFIGYLVNLVVSMCIGNGAYIPAMPFLVEHCGS